MRKLLEDKRKMKVIAFVVGGFLIIFFSAILIHLFTGNKPIKKGGSEKELSSAIITMQVVDYENPATWESRYNLSTLTTALYNGEEKVKDLNNNGLEPIINFHPEEKSVKSSPKDYLPKDTDTGIIYGLDLAKGEEYVASLLSKGYSLRRKILTSTNAEIYLRNTDGNTVRIMCLSDKMYMGELHGNIALPEMESYFKLAGNH